ncbi:hypothetical protein ACEQ8H_002547 [Pleosporales sp. CAS-2024a]
MIDLLRELRGQVSAQGQSRIDDMLAAVADDVADASASLKKGAGKNEGAQEDQEDANASAEADSPADLDVLDGDFDNHVQHREPFATTSADKTAETDWNRSRQFPRAGEDSGPSNAREEAIEAVTGRLATSVNRQPAAPMNSTFTNKANFFLDDETIEMDLNVDPLELPTFETAERLLEIYMTSCHDSFPFLAKTTFTQQFYHYYAASKRGQPYEPSRKWQTQLNLVFAIGALYAHLTSSVPRGDGLDHLVYHSRACALGLKDPWWFSQPDLPQMQITGLLSFYYLCAGYISRSWMLSGMALRFGRALGLANRNEDTATGPAKKEILARIWWGHCTLEGLLTTMTGRPSAGLSRTCCSVPLPLPLSSIQIDDAIIDSRFGGLPPRCASGHIRSASSTTMAMPDVRHQMDSEQSAPYLVPANSGSFLKSMVQLGEINQDVLGLYTTSLEDEPWQTIEENIGRLSGELDTWARCLPDGFNFLRPVASARNAHIRERNILNILYHGTIILVTRPCLCRLDRRISNQPGGLSEFNQRSALACVASAKEVASLLPDGPVLDVTSMYETGPWWTMVHTIMQSIIVLLLEISYEAIQLPHDRREIIQSMKKLVRWLRVLKTNNEVARRAYFVIMQLLRVLVRSVKMDIADLVQEDEEAPGATAAANAHDTRLQSASSTTISYHELNYSRYGASVHVQDVSREGLRQVPHSIGAQDDVVGNVAPKYVDVLSGMGDASASAFPVSFLTRFDEQNPLPGFGAEEHSTRGMEDHVQMRAGIPSLHGHGSRQAHYAS